MYVMQQPMRPRSTHRLTSTQNDYAVASNLLGDFPVAWGGDIIISVTGSITVGTASAGSRDTNAALESINCGPMAASSLLTSASAVIGGRGGSGGAGAAVNSCNNGSGGGQGSSGLRTDNPMQVQNNGTLYGSGGGGGGGGGGSQEDCKSCGCEGTAGSGGAGAGSQNSFTQSGGGTGSFAAGNGGSGGAVGSSGSNGTSGTNGGCGVGSGGGGGAAGYYAVGFSLMTFTVAGTTGGGTSG